MDRRILVFHSACGAFLAGGFVDWVHEEIPSLNTYVSVIAPGSSRIGPETVRGKALELVCFVYDASLDARIERLAISVRETAPKVPLLFVHSVHDTRFPSLGNHLESSRVLPFPPSDGSYRLLIAQLLALNAVRSSDCTRSGLDSIDPPIVGKNPGFLRAVERMKILGRSDVPVIITGESGTGKERIARGIHYLGDRSGGPFISVNCGAIPNELVENEFFGHEEGAYTGANSKRTGRVAQAEGGTLFLDEIDKLPYTSQPKLLRFLQNSTYNMVGSSKMKKADVRVVAASNVDLVQEVKAGTFRKDLYWRLNVAAIHIPPLRERMDDIPALTLHFLEKYSRGDKQATAKCSDEVLQYFLSQNWLGNIRELESAIRSGVLFAQGKEVRLEHLNVAWHLMSKDGSSFMSLKEEYVHAVDQNLLRGYLAFANGNITKAAALAKLDRSQFRKLLKKSGLDD